MALHRFFTAHETLIQFQTPFAPFVHPKLPLGLCGRPPWRTATNWDFAGERARPGSRFRPRAAAPENSPAIYGWVHGSGMFQVPPGTKDPCGWPPLRTATLFFCRPSRDFYLCLTRYPAMNGWAIVIASLHNFVACAPACLGLRGQAPSPLPLCRRSKFGQLSGA